MAARGRPKKKGLWSEKQIIRVKVWEALKSQGHTLPIELAKGKSRLIRGHHSIKVAVADVAKELKCSQTTVWNAWAGFDPLSYEWGREKHQSDAEWDLAHEYRRETAIEFCSASSATRRNLPAKKLRPAPRNWTTTAATPKISYYKYIGINL